MSDHTAKSSSQGKMPNAARAGGIMMLFLFLSRILGLVRDAVIAHQFGASDFTDAYRLAFQIPDLLFFLVAGGALSSAFIPVFSEYLHTDREDEAWHVFSVVTTLMSIAVFVFIVAAWIFASPLAHALAPGKANSAHLSSLTPDQFYALMTTMSRIVLPAQFAFFIGGLMFGTLYARQVFAVPGLGPNVYNLGIIFGAIILSLFFTGSYGVVGMSWGALAGAVVGNLVIPLVAMRKIGMKFHVSFDVKHPGVIKVFKLMLPVVLGLSLPSVFALIMQWWGTNYTSGVNTFLEYSNKLMQAPLGIFGQSLAIGVFPALSQFYAQKRLDLYRNQLTSTLRTVIYLTVPVTVVMMIMAPQIVSALLKQGQFTAEDAAHTAEALRYFCIGVTAWCMHPVLMRGFYAAHVTVTPIVIGTVSTGIFVGLIYLLHATGLGFLELPLAGSLAAIILVVILTVAVTRVTNGLDFRGIVTTLWKSLLGSAGIAVPAAAVAMTPIADHIAGSKTLTIAAVAAVGFVGFWIYFYITRALGMPETNYLSRALERINRRRSGSAEA